MKKQKTILFLIFTLVCVLLCVSACSDSESEAVPTSNVVVLSLPFTAYIHGNDFPELLYIVVKFGLFK